MNKRNAGLVDHGVGQADQQAQDAARESRPVTAVGRCAKSGSDFDCRRTCSGGVAQVWHTIGTHFGPACVVATVQDFR